MGPGVRQPLLSLLVVVPLLGACTGAPSPAGAAADGRTPAAATATSDAPLPVEAPCAETVDAERAVCAYLTALDSGDVDGLTSDEQDMLRTDRRLRRGPWQILDCTSTALDTCDVSIGLPGGERQEVVFTVLHGEEGHVVAYYEDEREITSELEGCPLTDVVERTACEFLTAMETDEPELLRDDERRLLEQEDELAGPWELLDCELEGDVTVLCGVRYRETEGDRQLTLVPVNAVYDDGTLTPEPGKDIDYEVDGFGPAPEEGTTEGG